MKQKATAIPVQSQERIQVVDVLRGFAILGILLFNMRSFAGQSMSIEDWTEPLDRTIIILIDFFVQAKFYSLFSFLFGWGMAVQMRRAKAKGTKFLPVYLRRLLILFVFGTLHGVFLWTGDILRMYAVIGILLVVIFRNSSEKTLLVAFFLLLLSSIVMTIPGESMNTVREWCLGPRNCLTPDTAFPTSLYTSGTYWQVTQLRYQEFIGAIWWFPCYMGNVFAMMVLGLYVGKRNLFSNFEQHRNFFHKAMWSGLVIGLTFNGLFTYFTVHPLHSRYASLVRNGTRTIGAPALSIFYITALVLLFHTPKWRDRLAPAAFVGRMALTNYITHSVVLTLVFYGYGLGLYGETDPTFALLLTFFVYLVQIKFSKWYFERYQFGPMEWGWRKLTYGRINPLASTNIQGIPDHERKRRWMAIGFGTLVVAALGWGLIRGMENDSVIDSDLQTDNTSDATAPEDETIAVDEPAPISTPIVQPVDVEPGPAAAIGDMPTIAAAFDVESALAQIGFLTAPRYAGRVAGSPGGRAAGDYIATQFALNGLQPAGMNGTYFQEFPVNYVQYASAPYLAITGTDGTFYNEYVLHQDFAPLIGAYLGAGTGRGGVIWIKDCSHNSFGNLKIVDKVILCEDGDLKEIGRNVAENGAAGLLLLTDPNTIPPETGKAFLPVWIPQPVPAFRVYPNVIEDMLAGSGISFADLSLIFEPFDLPAYAELSIDVADACPAEGCFGRNVLGVLPGRDPVFADQVIIVGADYDSLGISPNGLVWDGASVNASGVAVLLEISRSWQEQGYAPRATVVFVAWDAEEQGSLGTEFYAQFPQYPPDNVLAFIQLDSLGAGGETLLIDGGGNVAETLRDAAEQVGASAQLTDDLPALPLAQANRLTWMSNNVILLSDQLENIDREKLAQAGEIVSLTLLGLSDGAGEIEELLSLRAQAVMDKDIISFLGTSLPTEHNNDRLWFEDARSLMPLSCKMTFDRLHVAGDTAVAEVTISLEVPGESGGLREFSLSMPTRFQYARGEWFWAGPDLLWLETPEDNGEPRFAVSYPHGRSQGLDGLGQQASARYAEVAKLLGLPGEVDARILLFESNEALRASSAMSLAGNVNAVSTQNTIKLTYSTEVAEGERFSEAIIHLALANAGVPRSTVPWLWQGLPLVVAAEVDPISVQASILPVLQTLSTSESVPVNSMTSWAAVDFLRGRLGWDGLGRFISDFGRACQKNDCATMAGTDIAFTTALRMDTDSFHRAWREYWSTELANTQSALDELLAARSDAVLNGDIYAFLATVDRQTPNLLREETDWFSDLSEYPVETFSLRAKPIAILKDGSVHASVTLAYQLKGQTARWAGGTSTFIVLFKPDGAGYRWAGIPLKSLSGDSVRVRYPAGQEELAAELLMNAQDIYAQLAAELNVSSPPWQSINLYTDASIYRTSIFLSYPNHEWLHGWSAQGHSIKLLLETEGSANSFRPALSVHFTRQLLMDMGIQDEWLLTGGSNYLARSIDNGASQMIVASNLYSLGRAIRDESLFDFSDFPALYRLSEDEYEIAISQAWDSVRFLAENFGQSALWGVLLADDIDDALLTTTRLTLPEFATGWQESFALGHSSPGWASIAESFDEKQALSHMDILSSPALAGRQAGSPGADLAAEYIAEKFSEYGLEVERQLFPINYQYYLDSPEMKFTQRDTGFQDTFVYREDFLILQAVNAGDSLTGELVWIMDPNYTGMDLGGNIAVRKPTGLIEDEIALAAAHGAGALILVGDLNRSEDLSAKYLAREIPPEGSIPALELTREGFKRLLEMSGETIAGIYNAPPAHFLGVGASIKIDLNEDNTAETSNILGFLPGSDPVLGREIIIVGAHYDHVGDDPERRYSGKNDNASGVATLLEIARLWQETGYTPERSVLFIAWGAQELGELGSRYYLDNPIFPLDHVIAMVQLDAVAGGDAYHLDAQGSREKEGQLLYSIEHAKVLLDGRLQLSFPDGRGESPFLPGVLFDRARIGVRSDHDPFRDAGIPALRIAWRDADETNLDDELADEIDPAHLSAAGGLIILTLMINAR